MSLQRQRQSSRPGPADAPATEAAAGGPQCVFGPDKAVAGIRFHLLDEGIADAVDAGSADAARRWLAGSPFQAARVPRRSWGGMSNAAKLHWLLAVTGTSYYVRGDRVAVIGPSR